MYREALAIDRRKLGDLHPEIAKKLVNLAILLRRTKQYEASAAASTEAIAIRRKVLGNDHPSLANALDNLASTLSEAGKRSEAEPLDREALAIARRSTGESSRETARLENNLAGILHELGRDDEAVPLARAAVAKSRKDGRQDPELLVYWLGLARTLNRIGDFRGAEATAREALEGFRTQAANPEIASTSIPLGESLVGQKRFAEALPPLREALAIMETRQPSRKPWIKPEAESVLGAALAGTGDRVESERHLLAGYEGLRTTNFTPVTYVRAGITRLVDFYTSTGNREQARVWRARLAEMH
jgi:tetratricopeptide (TPR) repeat protein